MGFFEEIKNTKKSQQDYWREFVEIVDMLPGLNSLFEDHLLDLHWNCTELEEAFGEDESTSPSLLTYDEDGGERKYTFPVWNSLTVTILVKDGSPYKVVIQPKEFQSWKLERQYDSKSKIEIACIFESEDRRLKAIRNPEMLEQVDVTFAYPRWNAPTSYNEIKGTRDISEVCCGDGENKCDIASLNAVVKIVLFRIDMREPSEREMHSCARNMQKVKNAVKKSNYIKQCCQYDKTVAEIFGRTQ